MAKDRRPALSRGGGRKENNDREMGEWWGVFVGVGGGGGGGWGGGFGGGLVGWGGGGGGSGLSERHARLTQRRRI